MNNSDPAPPYLDLTALIISAHTSNNAMTADSLPALIRSVYQTLLALRNNPPLADAPDKPQPAVPVKRSVFPDYIVCLEDGKKLKMLKRHLQTSYGMTPGQYRERWGLASDYPMVAPKYSARRSALAKERGLGQWRNKHATEPKVQVLPARRARGSKG